MCEGLSAHAVPLAGTSDFQIVVAGELQGIANIVFASDAYDAVLPSDSGGWRR